jgi:tRNA-dihydrouridine synthase
VTDRKVIFQIGSSDPELALQAAKIVQQDVAGMYVVSPINVVYNADI